MNKNLPSIVMGDFCFHDCAQIRAELDAYYVRLYGLTRDELRYTPFGVDPQRSPRRRFPWRDIPRAEGEGN